MINRTSRENCCFCFLFLESTFENFKSLIVWAIGLLCKKIIISGYGEIKNVELSVRKLRILVFTLSV